MNYHSISDSLWTDSGFRTLSTNARLLILALLSSPLTSFTGVYFATVGMLSEYTGLKNSDVDKAFSEIESIGFVVRCQDYVIIRNFLKHNKFNTKTHSVRIARDFNALPSGVFCAAMQVEIISETYSAACKSLGAEPRACEEVIRENGTTETKPEKPKVVKQQEPESEEIQRLRGYVAEIYRDFPNARNKPSLSTEEYQKLIDKWGAKLVVLQRIYYSWLCTYGKKHTHTDYGTLIKGGWVLDKANETDGQDAGLQPVIRHF